MRTAARPVAPRLRAWGLGLPWCDTAGRRSKDDPCAQAASGRVPHRRSPRTPGVDRRSPTSWRSLTPHQRHAAAPASPGAAATLLDWPRTGARNARAVAPQVARLAGPFLNLVAV